MWIFRSLKKNQITYSIWNCTLNNFTLVDRIHISNGFRNIWVQSADVCGTLWRNSEHLAPPYLTNHQKHWINHRERGYSEYNFGLDNCLNFFSACIIWKSIYYHHGEKSIEMGANGPYLSRFELKTDRFDISIGS